MPDAPNYNYALTGGAVYNNNGEPVASIGQISWDNDKTYRLSTWITSRGTTSPAPLPAPVSAFHSDLVEIHAADTQRLTSHFLGGVQFTAASDTLISYPAIAGIAANRTNAQIAISGITLAKNFSIVAITFDADITELLTGNHVLVQYKATDETDPVDWLGIRGGALAILSPHDNAWHTISSNSASTITPAEGDTLIIETAIGDDPNHPDGITFIPVVQRTGGGFVECNDIGGNSGWGVFSLDNLYVVINNTYEAVSRLVVLSRDGYETHADIQSRLGANHTEDYLGQIITSPGADRLTFTGTLDSEDELTITAGLGLNGHTQDFTIALPDGKTLRDYMEIFVRVKLPAGATGGLNPKASKVQGIFHVKTLIDDAADGESAISIELGGRGAPQFYCAINLSLAFNGTATQLTAEVYDGNQAQPQNCIGATIKAYGKRI